MGLDVSSGLVIAAEVRRADFFTVTGQKAWVCTRDNAHRVGSAKFCPECGSKVEVVDVEEPTKAFTAYAKAVGQTPVQAWDRWLDGGDEEIGLVRIESVVDPEARSPRYGLGLLLANSNSHRHGGDAPTPVDLNLSKEVEKICTLLLKVGIRTREVKLYPYAYLSY